MGYKLEFGKLSIGKKLRNVDEKIIKKSLKQVIYEEDKIETTLLPTTHSKSASSFKYKEL